MCDTQVLIADNGIWFAKNSDREPWEAQALVQIPAVQNDTNSTLRTTYINIPQVPNRHALVLSKPTWLWGGEMGVNEHGLAIGNEAIFSRQRSMKPALLGMDFVRLALERASSAQQGIDVITQLLESHGQGGPAGFTHKGFHYDSSFILADSREAWVLETAGKTWAARQVESYAAISNALSLGEQYQRHSADCDGSFKRHDSKLMPYFAASKTRRELSLRCLQNTSALGNASFLDMARHLRSHHVGRLSPIGGSNKDVCMHAAGVIRQSQTTGSMIAWLGPQGPRLAATGTSAPCLSLFRPLHMHLPGHAYAKSLHHAQLWQNWEGVHRAALFDAAYRKRVRAWIEQTENEVFSAWMEPASSYTDLDQQTATTSEFILRLPRPTRPANLGALRGFWAY